MRYRKLLKYDFLGNNIGHQVMPLRMLYIVSLVLYFPCYKIYGNHILNIYKNVRAIEKWSGTTLIEVDIGYRMVRLRLLYSDLNLYFHC